MPGEWEAVKFDSRKGRVAPPPWIRAFHQPQGTPLHLLVSFILFNIIHNLFTKRMCMHLSSIFLHEDNGKYFSFPILGNFSVQA